MNIKNFILSLIPQILVKAIRICRFNYAHHVSGSTKLFEKNKTLMSSHSHDRCFIVAPGSSINQQDLSKLKDEIVIAVSGLFTHRDIDIINPNYYVLAPVFQYHSDDVDPEYLLNWLKDMDRKLNDSVKMFIHIGDRERIINNKLFCHKEVYWTNYSYWDESMDVNISDLSSISSIKSVSETVMTVALFLGFEKIYLLGFDHDWFNGEFVYFDKEEYMKYWGCIEKKEKRKMVDSEFQMRRHAYIFSKYKMLYSVKNNIFNANANQNSYVDTFPKVYYEELFHD